MQDNSISKHNSIFRFFLSILYDPSVRKIGGASRKQMLSEIFKYQVAGNGNLVIIRM